MAIAFVEVHCLTEKELNESSIEAIKNTINGILGGEVAYSFPKDTTVTEPATDIPVVVKLTPVGQWHNIRFFELRPNIRKALMALIKRDVIMLYFEQFMWT